MRHQRRSASHPQSSDGAHVYLNSWRKWMMKPSLRAPASPWLTYPSLSSPSGPCVRLGCCCGDEGAEVEPLAFLEARWAKMSRIASLAEMKEGVWVNGRRLDAENGSAGTETVRWKPSVTPGIGGKGEGLDWWDVPGSGDGDVLFRTRDPTLRSRAKVSSSTLCDIC